MVEAAKHSPARSPKSRRSEAEVKREQGKSKHAAGKGRDETGTKGEDCAVQGGPVHGGPEHERGQGGSRAGSIPRTQALGEIRVQSRRCGDNMIPGPSG